jgi:hypothetical protein
MNRVAHFLGVLLVLAVAGLFFVATQYQVLDLPTEIAKALLQLVVVAAAGHVVSILITKANNQRQDLMRANELRHALLARLNKAYSDVKKIRRLARASSERTPVATAPQLSIPKSAFHRYLQALNDAQLELELLARDVKTNEALFTDARDIIDHLDGMEKFLNRIVGEYEGIAGNTTSNDAGRFAVTSMPWLANLLAPAATSTFRTDFVRPYHAALDAIRKAFSG